MQEAAGVPAVSSAATQPLLVSARDMSGWLGVARAHMASC